MVRDMGRTLSQSIASLQRWLQSLQTCDSRFTIDGSEQGTDAESAYQLIHDELSLDGNPLLNLASFVHTWMPEAADKLMIENMSKNLIDQDEYPMTRTSHLFPAYHPEWSEPFLEMIHTRCIICCSVHIELPLMTVFSGISILADLWHAPSSKQAIGTATTGSSEAIQLGGLAMKRLWQEKRKKAGLSIHEPGPNIVMGANAQVALEVHLPSAYFTTSCPRYRQKFARYFEVECRLVPISVESKYRLDPKKAMEYVDENTIGVFVILGSMPINSF